MYRLLLGTLLITSAFAEEAMAQFTGKITGNNVRLRAKPDLESPIVYQFHKNDVILVVGEKDNFYEVVSPKEVKAYVCKEYIVDNKVISTKVNIRLFPNTEALILGQIQNGETVYGQLFAEDNKWLVIDLPQNTHFFIAKDYVESIGNSELFAAFNAKKEFIEKNLTEAVTLCEKEMTKPYEEMNIQEPLAKLENIIKEGFEFQEKVKLAEENMKKLQDDFLKKKITYLEMHKSSVAEKSEFSPQIPNKSWSLVEKELFTNWSTFHSEKSEKDFYEEQLVNAISLKGFVDNFKPLKNRPGDFILKNSNNCPIAYLYSTVIDLSKYVGKEVTILVSPRANNNFAFPAYFVNKME